MSEWIDLTHSMIFLYTGQNGVPNAACDNHGYIDTGDTWDGERAWTDVAAAVEAHLAAEHPDLPANGAVLSDPDERVRP
jgi:hypothetical protein